MVLNRRSLEKLKSFSPGRGRVVTEKKQLSVFVRIKPLPGEDLSQSETIQIRNENTLILFYPKQDETPFFSHGVKQNPRNISKTQHKLIKYNFHNIFGPEKTNEDIYNESIKDLIDTLLSGYNCCVFVYGASGSGKTYTMLGNEINNGITFLTMKDLFEKVIEQQDTKKFEFEIYVSYLEVYNEMVFDLLVGDKKPLFLREIKNAFVDGSSIKMVNNADELIEMLHRGNSNRTQHPTDANVESSSSHALFQVYIKMTFKHSNRVKMAKLSMVDLAGSERASSNKGIRLKERSNNNRSLLALGNCINNLSNGLRHIPYRDSKLTKLLKDFLGGNCKTLMISCVSPSLSCFEDTHNTLEYASSACKIKSNLKKNVMPINHSPSYYVEKISDLKDENQRLKKILEEAMKSKAPIPPDNLEDLKLTLESLFAAKLKKHIEILRLELAQKKTELQIVIKKYSLERFSLLDVQNIDKMAIKLNRINMAIQQLEGCMASIDERLNELRGEAIANTNNLNLFIKKLETDNVKQFLEVEINQGNSKVINEQHAIVIEHKNEIGMILDSNLHTSLELITMLAEKASQYYTLLDAHNKVTQEMIKSHNNITKSFLDGLKAVSWDFSPENQCEIKRDVFFNLNKLSVENLEACKEPEFGNPKLEESMSRLQVFEDELQQITLHPENDKMDPLPELCSDKTGDILPQDESLNNTIVIKQIVDAGSTEQLPTIKRHRNKPPIYSQRLTKSIFKPIIQRKKLVPNCHKRKIVQKHTPLAILASKTLAERLSPKVLPQHKSV